MNEIEILIALVAVALVLVRLADLVAIPYPIVLVLAGLAIGFVSDASQIELAPEIVFLVFLPPLLQSAAYWASPEQLRAELSPLGGLVVGLSLLTMVAVAAVARAVIPELNWAEALLLGAILAPTDPIAAIAIFGRVGVTDRIAFLVEGESMVNDATALVAYRVALAAVVTGTFSAGEAAAELVLSVAGGIAIGLALSWVAVNALRRLDDPPLSILVSVLLSYVAFAVCEELELSGVLAVVAGGLYLSRHSHEAFDADTRLNAVAFWQVLVFALNAVLFILVGLQFPEILERIGETYSTAEVVGYGLIVAAVVVGVRIAWQFLSALGPASTGDDWRERLVIGWSGMRGGVSLAAALALPLQLDSGEAFASRDLLIYLTVAVILFTLVGQGLTLSPLIRVLGLEATRPWSPDEAFARLQAAQAALDRLDELEGMDDEIPEEAVDRLRELYRARFARCIAAIEGKEDGRRFEDPVSAYRELRRELIELERGVLAGLRGEGRLRVDDLRKIERDLDLDEARLRS